MHFFMNKLIVRANMEIKKKEEEYPKNNYHESVATM